MNVRFRSSIWCAVTAMALAASAAHAAVINLPDHSLVPDGTTQTSVQNTNVNIPNGGAVLLTGSDATFANALAIAVPEPGTWAILAASGALIGLRFARRRLQRV